MKISPGFDVRDTQTLLAIERAHIRRREELDVGLGDCLHEAKFPGTPSSPTRELCDRCQRDLDEMVGHTQTLDLQNDTNILQCIDQCLLVKDINLDLPDTGRDVGCVWARTIEQCDGCSGLNKGFDDPWIGKASMSIDGNEIERHNVDKSNTAGVVVDLRVWRVVLMMRMRCKNLAWLDGIYLLVAEVRIRPSFVSGFSHDNLASQSWSSLCANRTRNSQCVCTKALLVDESVRFVCQQLPCQPHGERMHMQQHSISGPAVAESSSKVVAMTLYTDDPDDIRRSQENRTSVVAGSELTLIPPRVTGVLHRLSYCSLAFTIKVSGPLSRFSKPGLVPSWYGFAVVVIGCGLRLKPDD